MAKATTSTASQTITIDIKPLLGPIANVFSAIIIAAAILISGSLNGARVAGTTTATDSGTSSSAAATTGQVTVSLAQVQSLFNDQKNITFGDKNSKLLLVEFSDPSCPYCHIAGGKNAELNKQAGAQFTLVSDGGTYVAPVAEMKKLVDQGKAAFAWVYTNGHGAGELSTQGLWCAYEKGKFWEVHDLYMNAAGYALINDKVKNDVANSGALADFTNSVIPAAEMKSCLESGKYAGKLAEGQSTAASFGVSGTPGFFVNENNFAGAYSFSDMQSTVNKFI